MKVWLDGAVLEPGEARVPVSDHGLTVGDGVFETMKVVAGVPFALSRHLTRLRASGALLGLAVPDESTLRGAVDELLAAHAPGEVGRLRVTVTGGDGPAGTERGTSGPTVLLVAGTLRGWPPSAAVTLVPWARNERSATTGAKTTSYAENVVALARAKEVGADEALFLDTRGTISECTGSNLFMVIGGRVVTPALTTGCLAGVTRALVIEWSGADQVELPEGALDDADEVFLTSSTRDVQAVRSIDRRSYQAPGPVTARVAAEFSRRMAADLDP